MDNLETLVTDVGKTCVEKLIDRAIAETRYVCCFTSIAYKFKTQKARLEAERRTVEQRVNAARERGNNILYNVEEWKKQVDEIIKKDTKKEKKCFFGFCPNCIWRYKMGKELEDKTENMKQLVEEKFENIEISRRLPDIELHSSQNYIHFKGRESKYKELLDALKDENNFITGLHGMGGSGKTTLAKKVGNVLKQSEKFDCVIFTTVSNTPNIKKIQDDIAGPLGLKWQDCNESDRPKKLWSRLTNGENILLILDDVWDWKPPLDFDAIGIPKRDNHKGCRILVTTRDKRVLKMMSCDKIIILEFLSEEDAWTMFETITHCPKNLINKGRIIVNECKRLPVAISVVAHSLKCQQSPEEWDVALKSLQNPLSSVQGVEDESLVEIYRCLKFSYEYLKDEKAKGLFRLCSVFPEDEEIPIETLTRLGVGSGLFGEDYGSYNDARNQVVVAKDKLLDSCLLLEVGKGLVKMHDLVRDVAQRISNKEIRLVNVSHKVPKSFVEREENTKYLFCEGNLKEMFSSSFGGSKLEILIVFGDDACVEVPNLFFENMAGLRALHLECKHRYPAKLALPNSIESLTNIRSVLVGRVHLGDISVLGKLQCLEALELCWCKIDELPHEITKLEKFKLLKLKSCQIRRKNPFDVIGKCSSLEELYFIDSFNNFCQGINFPTLQRYHCFRTSKRIEVDVSLSKCVGFRGDRFSEASLKYFMQTAESLTLGEIKWQWRSLIPEMVSVYQGMNDLIVLNLFSIFELQYLINTISSQVQNVFSKLVVLKLHGMKNLKELCNCPLSSDSLKNLETLSIRDCINLRSLFKFNPNLCSLTTIELKNCSSLVSLFKLSTVQSLLMLEKLDIYDCEQLESIITDEERMEQSKEEILVDDGDNDKKHNSGFQKLKELRISRCPMLVSLFPLSIAQNLMMLEKLDILCCEKLESIIIDDIKGMESKQEILVDGDSDNKKYSSMFSKLKALDIQTCPQLELILSFHSRDLPVLETINIYGCGKLKYIFDQFVKFGSLKRLELHGLPTFIDVFQKYAHHMPLFVKGSSSSPIDGFEAPIQLDPIKCNVFSWTNICRYGHKYRHKLRSTTGTKLPTVSEDQPQHCRIASELSCNWVALDSMRLNDLSVMTNLFVGPKNSITLQNLREVEIGQCKNMEIIFPASVVRCLPQLLQLRIEECKELKHIIEDDMENKKGSNYMSPTRTCFPKLKILVVVNCNKLKSVFPVSICQELPQLKFLIIREAYELQEIFKSEDDRKVKIPYLKLIEFDNLPSLCQAQEIHFRDVENRLVKNCQKLSLTSASTLRDGDPTEIYDAYLDYARYLNIRSQLEKLAKDSETQAETKVQAGELTSLQEEGDGKTSTPSRSTSETSDQKVKDENLSAETSKDFATGVEVQEALGHELSPSQCLEETKNQSIKETSTSEKDTAIVLSTNSELRSQPPTELATPKSKQENFNTSVEQGTTLDNVKTVTSSTHLESINSSSGPLITSEHKASLQLKDDEARVSEPNPSPTRPSLTPHEGNSSSLITWELQQLVSKKHLAFENLTLLTDFLIKHPSVSLSENSLSNRYKGYAYSCLAELLKFLQTHSVLDVLETSRSEFVELLQDARRFAFDKGWLDGIEKRALFPDLQDSQDALEKLFHSKQQVSQHLEDLKHQITSCEADLESIIQQEAQVLESRAALSAPLGY